MLKLDSPLINFLNKAADIMILNFLFLIFSIPIVTIGASFSAAYYMGFKMVKNEESYLIRGFWKAFKENFKQSTVMWLIILVAAGLLAADYRIMKYSGIVFANWMKIAIVTVTVVVLMGVSYMFPLQARFVNSVKGTIRNSFLVALSHLPTTLLLLALYPLPVIILYFWPQSVPILLLFSFGLIIYFKSFLLLKVFKKYEEAFLAAQEEAEGPENADSELLESSREDITAEKAAPTKVFRDGKFVEVSENDSEINK